VAEGDLIVVSAGAPDGRTGGRVWRVNAAGAASLVGTILTPGGESRAYLEGVITVPANLNKYGPWSGKIVIGGADRTKTTNGFSNGKNPKIYAIDPRVMPANPLTKAVCSQNESSVNSQSCERTYTISGPVPNPKDLDFIEGEFFGAASANSTANAQRFVLKSPAANFSAQTSNYPDILVTQEYPVSQPNLLKGESEPIGANSGLYEITWDSATNKFVSSQLPKKGGPEYTRWEQVTFVPTSDIALTTNPRNAKFAAGQQLSFTTIVSGIGPGTATEITVKSSLPSGGGLLWSFDPANSTALDDGEKCAVDTSQTLQCNFHRLRAGDQAIMVVRTSNPGGAPAAACTGMRIENNASARADGTTAKQNIAYYACR